MRDTLDFSGRKVLIASGGTGGHIIPAIVFGRWLESRGAVVTWLVDSRPLALEIYASHGIKQLMQLSIEGSPLGVKNPVKILRRSWHMLTSLSESARCLTKTGAEIVFLFGGYVSFAPLIVSYWRKIPVIMHEQNAIAGRVTRLASRMGATVTTGWAECLELNAKQKSSGFTHVGIPVREPNLLGRCDALRHYGLDDLAARVQTSENSENGEKIKIVGVAGGSLGSKPLTAKLIAAARIFDANTQQAKSQEQAQVEFVLLNNAPEELDNLPKNLHFVGRQWDVNPLYSMCDVLVCRAGGSTLAEALAWQIPTVVVPWEGSAGGHQHENARCFVDEVTAMGIGGILCSESRNNTGDLTLVDAIARLLQHGRGPVNSANFDKACCALAEVAQKIS